ncbi:MAG: molybdate ABC transporter substrate-binding protein [Robiginitomaculum sp.]|nr:MAG: molybdate ABC transporter substrate-binding protein [Robiginitomaculum sp.]
MSRLALVVCLSLLGSSCAPAAIKTVYIATASNFRPVITALVADLETACDVAVSVSSGSTGTLISQISQGAPFDLLISADPELSRQQLQDHPIIAFDPPFARALMAYWHPAANDPAAPVAIANPDTAPFGRAAMAVIGSDPGNLVRGANAAQAFAFVHLGAASAGYVPLSLLLAAGITEDQYEVIDPQRAPPILLQLVRVKPGQEASCVAGALYARLSTQFLVAKGYGAP